MAEDIRPRILPVAGMLLVAGLAALGLKALSLPNPGPDIAFSAGYFSHALSAAQTVEEPVVGGVRYEVRGGRPTLDGQPVEAQLLRGEVLRLAYALSLARRAPVFSLEGASLEQVRREVAAIAALQDRLAERESDPQGSSAVAGGLFPTAFLDQLIDFEEARRTFLNHGTTGSLAAYEAATEQAVTAYQEDLQRFKDSFISVVPEDIAEYQVPAGVVRRSSFLASIGHLQQRAAAAQNIAKKQRECLRGAVISCDATALTLSVPASKSVSGVEVAVDFLPEILALHEGSALGLQKPAVLLADSICIPASLALPLYTLRTEQDNLLLFVGEAFFVDTAGAAEAPFYRFFSARGLPYWLYPPATTYSCPGMAGEYARVQHVLHIRALVEEAPLSRYASGAARERLLELEERIASATEVLPETLATDYLAGVVEHANNTADFPLPALRAIESMALARQTHSFGLSGLLRHLTTELTTNLGLADAGAPVIMDARNLFYLRSGYFGLFLGHAFGEEATGPVRSTGTPELPLGRFTLLRTTVPFSSLARYVDYFFAIHAQPDMITRPVPWQRN